MDSSNLIKVDKWDTNDVKNALDDNIRKIMVDDFQYKEQFQIIDTRLFICTLSVAIALFGLLWDYLNPFPLSKTVLIFCTVSYFVLMSVLTWFSVYVEKNIFVTVKHHKMPRIFKISSNLKKFDDMYSLSLEMFDSNLKKTRLATKAWSVSGFINEDGYVLNDQLKNKVKKLHDSLSDERKDK